jgi:hypothetical protein
MVIPGRISESVYGMAEIGDVPSADLVVSAIPRDTKNRPTKNVIYRLTI